MQSCLTFGNSRILAETLVVVGHEGKVEKEEDEEAEEEEEEDEGKVQVNAETCRDLHISHEALKSVLYVQC